MSNLLTNYAVSINRNVQASLASKAYLQKLGVIISKGADFPQDDNGDLDIDYVEVSKYGSPEPLSDGTLLNVGAGTGTVAAMSVDSGSGLPTFLDPNPSHGDVYTVTNDGDLLIDRAGTVQAVSAGDELAWDNVNQNWVYYGATVYDDADALFYVDPNDNLEFLISSLGSLNLVFTRDASTLAALADSRFFNLTYLGQMPLYQITGSISTWPGVFWYNPVDSAEAGGFVTANSNNMFECVNGDGTKNAATRCSAIATMLGSSEWSNNQYSSFYPNGDVTTGIRAAQVAFTNLPASNAAFDDNQTFYLWDEENQASFLGFLVTKTGLSATTPYIREEIEIDLQNDFLSYISINESFNIQTAQKVIQRRFDKIIKRYIDAGYLDGQQENSVTIAKGNDRFYIVGDLVLTNAAALWRAEISAYYSEKGVN